MLTTHPILGNIYINQIESDSNFISWRHRMPSFGEAIGESFLEAVLTLEGNGMLNEYFNMSSFQENGKVIKKQKECGVANLQFRKYYGETVFEIGEDDIDIYDNFGNPPQINEIFNVSIIFYHSDGYVFFWLNKAGIKSMSLIGVIKEDNSDLTEVSDALVAMLEHLIVPVFLKLMLVNHESSFAAKLHSKNYDHCKTIVDITNEFEELNLKYNKIKSLQSRF